MGMTPLDLVKCNAQVNKAHFPDTWTSFRNLYSGKVSHLGYGQGVAALARGWAPTWWGYALQGFVRFGMYEYLKYNLPRWGVMHDETALQKSTLLLVSAAAGEALADVVLCPFEAVKVRVQTNPTFAGGLLDGMPKMIRREGWGSLYAGLGALVGRQVPYTVVKFVCFERIASLVYIAVERRTGLHKDDMGKLQQLGVVFSSGYAAGVLCGIASHPADTMVSKIYNESSCGSTLEKMKRVYSGTPGRPGIGFVGLWGGFWPRVGMIGTLAAMQWVIYGGFRTAVGLPAPGEVRNKNGV